MISNRRLSPPGERQPQAWTDARITGNLEADVSAEAQVAAATDNECCLMYLPEKTVIAAMNTSTTENKSD